MRALGHHPDTGEDITVRRGPYGLYAQQGENSEDKKHKPRRTSLPRGMDGDQITLEQALGLLSLPREIGLHPETGESIQAGIGRFGPYVRMGAIYGSLDRDDDVLAIGINRAVDLIARKMASVRTIGAHPADKELIAVRKGRFGPYVQHGKTVANLPRGVMMEEITLDQAVALLAEKGKQLRPRGAGDVADAPPPRRSRNPLPRRRPRRRPNRPPNDGRRRPNAQRRSWRPKLPLPARRQRRRRRRRAARRLRPARQRGGGSDHRCGSLARCGSRRRRHTHTVPAVTQHAARG